MNPNPARTMIPHDFIARWNGADGSERANFSMFFSERT
jgi:hypothetical protein